MELRLPLVLASTQDLARVYFELREFIDLVNRSIMRHDKNIQYPTISATLKSLAVANQLDLLNDDICKDLLNTLNGLKHQAPIVNISFPSNPSPEVVQKLVLWFRESVDPNMFIKISIQPSIAAGIVVNTPSRHFDFSISKNFDSHKDKLINALKV